MSFGEVGPKPKKVLSMICLGVVWMRFHERGLAIVEKMGGRLFSRIPMESLLSDKKSLFMKALLILRARSQHVYVSE